MIVAFTSFILSLIGIIVMLTLRMHKMKTGKAYVIFRSDKFDRYLRIKLQEMKTTLSFFNRKTLRLLFHFVLDKIEEKFVKMKDVGHHKAKGLIEKAKARESKISLSDKAPDFIAKIKDHRTQQ